MLDDRGRIWLCIECAGFAVGLGWRGRPCLKRRVTTLSVQHTKSAWGWTGIDGLMIIWATYRWRWQGADAVGRRGRCAGGPCGRKIWNFELGGGVVLISAPPPKYETGLHEPGLGCLAEARCIISPPPVLFAVPPPPPRHPSILVATTYGLACCIKQLCLFLISTRHRALAKFAP